MDSRSRRIGALEELVERRVEEELRAVLEDLEKRLPHEEFVRVARIIAGFGEEDDSREEARSERF